MKIKKLPSMIIAVFASIFLIMVILLGSIQYVVFNVDFYRAEYAKYNIYDKMGVSKEELIRITEHLLGYLQGKNNDLSAVGVVKGQKISIFNSREIRHMVDVKQLFRVGFAYKQAALMGFFILFILLYLFLKKRTLAYLARAFLYCVCAIGLLILIILFTVKMDFTNFWDNFHYVLFDNDLWLLNPDTDLLIQMFPEEFFNDMVNRILSVFFTVIAVPIAISIIFSRKRLEYDFK